LTWVISSGIQCMRVLIVVVFSSLYVLRIASQRELRTPLYTFCWNERSTISIAAMEDLPLPTGPITARTSELSLWNFKAVGVGL
jgi:hypothetical protein